MPAIIRLSGLALLSTTIALALTGAATACMAPRVYFKDRSSELPQKFDALDLMRKSDPSCRYKLIGHVSAQEAREDPTLSLSRHRAEAVAAGFDKAGIARDRFDIAIGEIKYEGLIGPFVTIHSVAQPGQVQCIEPITTCPVCIRKLPSGGECRLISGGEY